MSPSVLRYLRATGEEYAARDGGDFGQLRLALGAEHPAYEALADRLPNSNPPYAWYLRVPDLPGFLWRIRRCWNADWPGRRWSATAAS